MFQAIQVLILHLVKYVVFYYIIPLNGELVVIFSRDNCEQSDGNRLTVLFFK